jgi:hypothetical protein
MGTAMVYPALLAAVGDVAHPSWRGSAVGIYGLWRDLGYAAGALLAGGLADVLGMPWAIAAIGGLTLLSGVVAGTNARDACLRRVLACEHSRRWSMGDPRQVRPDELDILIARELRKAGVTLSALTEVARHTSKGKDAPEFSVELSAVVVHGDVTHDVLIECRNSVLPVDAASVQALDARRRVAPASEGPKRLLEAPAARADALFTRPAIMFSTSGYEPDAVRESIPLGIELLAIADGPAAFRRSPWSVGPQPPAWVPEYMAELVDLDPAGAVRHRMLVPGALKLVRPH